MTILILGTPEDEHAGHMVRHLSARGRDVELLDSRWFPAEMQIAFDPGNGSGWYRLPNRRVIRFEHIESVYWRSYGGVGPVELPDPEQSYIAANDARSLFESILIRLPARWVNGWKAFQSHQTKPAQLAMVAALGITIPGTLLTNDPQAVRDYSSGSSPLIFKPVQGGAHTVRLTKAHLSETNLASLAYSPVTLQEEIPGTNIRVFVAGTRVCACEVRTPAVDFREDAEPEILVHDLPGAIEQQSLQIARALDLVWTGIDFRLTPDGRYVFLEANPSPMFLGFERATGLPLTENIAALLMGPFGSFGVD